MKRKVALTGGYASGKSTVALFLREFGVPVVEADALAHRVLQEEAVRQQVREVFGEEVFRGDEVDRRKLGERVFRDAAALAQLEAITHPRIRVLLEEYEERALRVFGVVVSVIPLLFEKKMVEDYQEVWLAYAREETCIARARERDGLAEEEVRRRIAAQWPIERKRALADRVIDTEVPLKVLRQAVWRCVREWLDLP